jgi:hypothetical protein
MKRTIRNRRRERRAIRQAQRAMIGCDQGHEVVGPKFWPGLINALLIMAGFVAFGCAAFFFLGGTLR